MNIIEILKEDYQRFPLNQTYTIYAANVYFKDPLNEFRGIKRYQKMIGFLQKWFKNIHLDLHQISKTQNLIETEWTLYLVSPLPWQPCLAIPGRSELTLDQNGQIASHIDYWKCSPFDVVKQNFSPNSGIATHNRER